MVTSQYIGERKWLGEQECSEAGIFRLFGLRRINTVTPEPYPSVQNRKHSRHSRTTMNVMPLLHGPSLQVYHSHRMKIGTYRKFGIVRSLATN